MAIFLAITTNSWRHVAVRSSLFTSSFRAIQAIRQADALGNCSMRCLPPAPMKSYCLCPVWRASPTYDVYCWGEYAVKSGEIHPWLRNQGDEPDDEVQQLEDDTPGVRPKVLENKQDILQKRIRFSRSGSDKCHPAGYRDAVGNPGYTDRPGSGRRHHYWFQHGPYRARPRWHRHRRR